MLDTVISTFLCWAGSKLLSRSGEQLYVADRYSDQDPRPLLEILADPSERLSRSADAELVFRDALDRFKTIHIFANG